MKKILFILIGITSYLLGMDSAAYYSKDNSLKVIIDKYPKTNRLYAGILSDLSSTYKTEYGAHISEQNYLLFPIDTDAKITKTKETVQQWNNNNNRVPCFMSNYECLTFSKVILFVVSKKELSKPFPTPPLLNRLNKEILNSKVGDVIFAPTSASYSVSYHETDEQLFLQFDCLPQSLPTKTAISIQLNCEKS